MNTVQKGVKEFHEKHKHLVQRAPKMISTKLRLTRSRFLQEEVAEFSTAADKGDMVGMIDALGDILYFAYGAAVCLGVDMSPISNEIQRSNMTKPVTDAGSTGKVEKDEGYEPPDIEAELIRQGWVRETW